MITHGASDQIATLLDQGMAAMKAGNKEAAFAVFRFATEIDPDNETAWLWLASIYTELPRIAQCLQRVVELNPQNEQATRALQSVMARLQASQAQPVGGVQMAEGPDGEFGRFDQSANEPMTGYSQDSLRISGWLARQGASDLDFEEVKRRGIVAAKGGRYEEAAEYLMLAVEKNESDPEAWYWLSTVIEEPEEKQIALENVLTLEPEHPAAQAAMQANAPDLERKRSAKATEPDYQPDVPLAPPVSLDTHGYAGEPAGYYGNSRLMTQIMGASGAGKPPAPGQVVGGRYTVLRNMRGGGGSDIASWDATTRHFYLLRPHIGDAAELGGAASVGTVVHDGTRYTVLPVETKGLSLSSFIRTVGGLPPALVAQYGLSMLKTLQAEQNQSSTANSQKSLRPDTITLDGNANISLEPPSSEHSTMSLSSHAKPYIPPEQLERGLLSPTSDIYSIGAILFFTLTGAPPSLDRIPRKEGETFVPPTFAAFGDAPEDLARVITTALQANPLERYSSVKEMYDALKATEAGSGFVLPFSIKQMAITAGVIGALLFGLVVIVPKLKDIHLQLPFGGSQNQALTATPVPAPVVVATQPPAPPAVSKLILNGVDSRRFPQNSAFFSALDAAGAPIPGLTSGIVTLKENGQDVGPVQLVQLNKTLDPISVIVALDTSDKMAGRAMDDAKTAVHILADGLQPGDQMALLTFGGSAQLAVDYTVSKSAFLAGVDSQVAGNRRAIEDSFRQAANLVESQSQGGYTVLIVVTNGGLPSKPQDLAPLTGPANEANMPVFFLGLEPATYPGNAATQLANATGGLSFKSEKPEAGPAGEAMKLIEKQLHQVYKLTFDSHAQGAGAPHNLELTVTAAPNALTQKRSYQVWPSH